MHADQSNRNGVVGLSEVGGLDVDDCHAAFESLRNLWFFESFASPGSSNFPENPSYGYASN
jgi:hypothetical protein